MVQMYQADNHYLISMDSFKTFSEAKEAVAELYKQYADYTFEIVGAGVGGIGQYFIKGHAEEGKTIKPTRKKMRRKGGLHPITLEEAIELLQDDCERDNVMFRCVKRGRVMFLRVTDLKWVFDDSQDTENFLGADFYWEETVDGEER